jgi:hypothetical protein
LQDLYYAFPEILNSQFSILKLDQLVIEY